MAQLKLSLLHDNEAIEVVLSPESLKNLVKVSSNCSLSYEDVIAAALLNLKLEDKATIACILYAYDNIKDATIRYRLYHQKLLGVDHTRQWLLDNKVIAQGTKFILSAYQYVRRSK